MPLPSIAEQNSPLPRASKATWLSRLSAIFFWFLRYFWSSQTIGTITTTITMNLFSLEKVSLATCVFAILGFGIWFQANRNINMESITASINNGDYDRAYDQLNEYVKLFDDNHKAWKYLGDIQHLRGENKEALLSYKRSLLALPQQPKVKISVALVQEDLGNLDAAIELYKEALALDDESPQALMRMVELSIRSRDLTGAMDYARKLHDVKLDQESAAYLALAYHYNWSFDKRDKALEAARNSGYHGLGEIEAMMDEKSSILGESETLANAIELYNDGQYDKAQVLLVEQLQEQQTDYLAWAYKGHCQLAQSDLDSAQTTYNKAIELNPKGLEAIGGLAKLALAQEDYELAKAHYKHVLEVNPNQQAAYGGLVKSLIEMKDYKEAIKYGQIGRALSPDNTEISVNLSLAFHFAKDYKSRDEIAKSLIEAELKSEDELAELFRAKRSKKRHRRSRS